MSVSYNVQLIPQTTHMSCWAAGIAMIRGWKDHMSIDSLTIAQNKGGVSYLSQFKDGGLIPSDTYILRRWGFVTEPPTCYTEEGFEALLRQYGPLWVASEAPGPHIRVVTGFWAKPKAHLPTVFINDPWERGMKHFHWPNKGAKYSVSYSKFGGQMEDLGFHESREKAPIYVAHLP